MRGIVMAGAAGLLAAGAAVAAAVSVGPPQVLRVDAGLRVDVPVAGGSLSESLREVALVSGDVWTGRAVLAIERVTTRAGLATRDGVKVTLGARGRDATMPITAPKRRYKYLGYDRDRRSGRLQVTLWSAAPPSRPLKDDGCLRLTSLGLTPGVVQMRGLELVPVFEHAILLVLRGPDGRVLARTPLTARDRRWQGTLPIPASSTGVGTAEAVVGSAKDGSLRCLVHAAVRLSPTRSEEGRPPLLPPRR
ncbi:MAG: Gmad2 immunoglobulin-like domain-containing protein [Thermoleophilia bacterium]|jgi:hypothetical protein|nr:Gmad2 immunoglobulin-like domain-containing protein [Thermoleophilia bacterium]